MTKKLHRYFWIVLLAFLVACQNQAVSETSTSTPTVVALTLQTPTTLPTKIHPSPTPLPSFPLDGYIIVFEKEGELYFQDGNNLPIQLTHGGEVPHSPIISDDNTKIVFIRGEASVNTYAYSNIYSVNADGSEAQALITPKWLVTYGEEMGVNHLSFEPGTHQLRFNVCQTQEYSAPCLASSFFVNTDTGETKENSHNYFYTSPDGKMALDVSSGYIDIVDMNGKLIRQNILPYKVTTPVTIYPDLQWLPDSSGLIVALPVSEQLSVYVGNLTYTVWRYTIENNTVIQIPLDPTPAKTFAQCAEVISESPDGNWGLYNSAESELYLWNINDNSATQLYDTSAYCSQPSWSPDNTRFIYGGSGEPYFLGSINGAPIPIDGIFREWIDASHFLYADITDKNVPRTRVGEIVGKTILTYDLGPYLLIRPK